METPMETANPLAEEILTFWFGPPGGPPLANQGLWWSKDPELDARIAVRFGTALEAAARGAYEEWTAAPRSALALVVLLDQLSRNVWRGTPRAFAQDERALRVSLAGQERGHDRQLAPVERWFFYMPLMHAEDPAIQQQAVRTFARLADEAPPDLRQACELALDFAERHRVIVERFGRFPHRNAILGRPSTPEELAFLKEPGSSF
jgi:uncharacterized protein (DUF924 family)